MRPSRSLNRYRLFKIQFRLRVLAIYLVCSWLGKFFLVEPRLFEFGYTARHSVGTARRTNKRELPAIAGFIVHGWPRQKSRRHILG